MDRQQKLVIRAALNSAYMKETAENLVRGYKDLDANPVETKLGQALKGALNILDFDLEEEDARQRRADNDSDESSDRGSSDTDSESTDPQ